MITAMIGPPRDPSECEAYAAMCIDAFGLPPLARHDWLTRIDPANVRLTRDGDRVTGGLSLLPMGMWIGGKRVSITIVHLVVVAPADRKRGIGRALVGAALDELHRSGTALSVLYAATEDIYRHLGYEEAGSCVRYRVRLDQLTGITDDRLPEPVARSERPALHAAYGERARSTGGNLDRSPWAWQRVLDPGGDAAEPIRITEPDGSIAGYVVLQRAGADLHLRDLVALSPFAETRLFALLANRPEPHVEWNGPPDAHYDPAVERLHGQHWFARVCDLRSALASRGYRSVARVTLHLDVRDDRFPTNAGRWVLVVADAMAELRRGGEGRLRLDIRGLAALVTGHASSDDLVVRGLLDGPAEDLVELTRVFAGPAPWMPDLF